MMKVEASGNDISSSGQIALLPMKQLTMKEEESDASMRQRLVTSLSQSFPGSALSKALQCMDSDDELSLDPLSSSCFSEIRLDKGDDLDDDDDLTSLAWLQDTDLLKNINAGESDGQKENEGIKQEGEHYSHSHPPHVPYNPQKHINSKPPYSFSCLIFMAIEDSTLKKLPVKDIYSWIVTHFPYFQNAPTGWKNSVRHNLSLNKCFKKVDKDKGQSIGKGSLWCIDPDYRPNLLQALRKTPYHPYHQLQMLANPQPSQQFCSLLNNGQGLNYNSRPMPLSPRPNSNTISPHLFPFLSKRLAQSNKDFDSDVHDVAFTLVSLKGLSGRSEGSMAPSELARLGLKRKNRSPLTFKRQMMGSIVCTLNPSEDHTYSATSSRDIASPGSSIDEEYDFGSDDDVEDASDFDDSDFEEFDSSGEAENSGRSRRPKMAAKKQCMSQAEADEEQQKIVDGADALLNLAGIKTSNIMPLRSISPLTNTAAVKTEPS